jgi:Tfp pilus assembly protein PilF
VRFLFGPLIHGLCVSMEEAAEANCDALIARALSIASDNPEARLSLASIRMSQQRFEEAKEVIVKLYQDIEGLDSCRSLCLS